MKPQAAAPSPLPWWRAFDKVAISGGMMKTYFAVAALLALVHFLKRLSPRGGLSSRKPTLCRL